jgi:hypothetical protein
MLHSSSKFSYHHVILFSTAVQQLRSVVQVTVHAMQSVKCVQLSQRMHA